MTTHTLLLCTVGGTPEPVARSLTHWRPARVIFLPTAQTRSTVDSALRAFAENHGTALSPGQYEIKLVDDAEDFTACVQSFKSLHCDVVEWASRSGGNYRVVIDFTAGTKCMSAALALVARRWPCTFSYIGGTRRTKGGVGIVESGSEQVIHSENPWNALGYQAIEDAVTLFNHGRYSAAADMLEQTAIRTNDGALKRTLFTLKQLINAYTAWDCFDHQSAQTKFDRVIKNQNDLIVTFADNNSLLCQIRQHRDHVARLAKQHAHEPTDDWVKDLVQNARRRAAEGRYDDAVARLYRAAEALAQVRLRSQYNIPDTSKVPLEKVPEPLKTRWACKANGNGELKIGLQDAYELLNALGDLLGKKFDESDLKSPLGARNQSILAHGFQPVKERVYHALHNNLCSMAELEPQSTDWRLPDPG